MKKIIENGEEMEITDEQAARLVAADMIYSCDCGEGFYHLEIGLNFNDVESFLKGHPIGVMA
jgi:hypothetical protein